ncbi:MAG: hypothetical protein ACR2KX_03000 [Chitinophagaceae bacterium]
MKKVIIFAASLILFWLNSHSQGCIAVRNISGFGQYNFTDNAFSTSNWQIDLTGRYFKSFRDYKETIDQKTLSQNESVNHVSSLDISISRLFSKGWSVNFSLPITANARTASFEHGGPNTKRYTTHSFGVGDIRLTAYKWLLQPAVKQRWNIQLGVGIKLPTGDYKYQDYFYRNDTTRILSAVNPSIQLGDGGTGFITEVNTFYIINKTFSLYGNFYYLINPRDQNGVAFTAGRTPTSLQIRAGAVENSVPDVYSIRAGAYINLHNLSFSAGLRDEGSPVHDLIGESNGVRRAGHNLSVEPGILYRIKNTTLYAYVPVIVGRRIKQNVPDKNITDITGVYTVGMGGSGNYLVFAGVTFKL